MRVSKEQVAEHRERILTVAASLFRQHGFDGVGIADIMKGAGLTHGGFYRHFTSKEDLMMQVSARSLAGSAQKWERILSEEGEDSVEMIVKGYLSEAHFENRARGCALPALCGDAARQPLSIRSAFGNGLKPLIKVLSGIVPGASSAVRRRKAISTMAELVGAMVLARCVDDPKLSREILATVSNNLVEHIAR
jgi:TetR/AcrR family transcriptional regulator, transcriptional repressor for nem operon